MRPSSRTRMAWLLVWILLGAWLTAAILGGLASPRTLGIYAIIFGLWGFWTSGGKRIDAVAVLFLASSLFVGVAALIMPGHEMASRITLAGAIYISQLLLAFVVALAWSAERLPGTGNPATGTLLRSPMILSATAMLTGSILGFCSGVALSRVATLSNLAAGMIWVSPLVATLGAASVRRPGPLPFLIPGAILAAHLALWQGGGRLTVLAIILGMIIVFQNRIPPRTRLVKVAIPLAMIPGLLVAALVEANRRQPDRSLLQLPDQFSPFDALYSVWSPLHLFDSILTESLGGLLQHHGLQSFMAASVVWIPRALWPSKPDGWGRELALYFNPQAGAISGYSEAGLLPAEFIWAWGLPGLLAGAIGTAAIVRLIGGGLRRIASTTPPRGQCHPALVAWAAAACALMTLWWGGTFDFLGRTTTQVLGLVAILAPAAMIEHLFAQKRAQRRRSSAPPLGIGPSPTDRRSHNYAPTGGDHYGLEDGSELGFDT